MNINQSINDFNDSMSTMMLEKRNSLDTPWKQAVIKRYTVAIMGNFQLWLSEIQQHVKTPEAKFAGLVNSYDEMKDNHVGQLRDFYEQFGRWLVEDIEASYRIATRDERIHIENHISDGYKDYSIGLYILALIAFFEHSSHIFMPLFAEFEKALWCKQSEYVRCHSEVDFEHARLMIHWLEKELQAGYSDAESIIAVAKHDVQWLLTALR